MNSRNGHGLSSKLWLYTNFDCNLACSYCVTKSEPKAPRRELGRSRVRQTIDEALALGFRDLFFTGGEPFLLDGIYDTLAYASGRTRTTVLTNAVLLNGRRLQRLCEAANENLVVQVSLDGARPAHHDVYRGQGTWKKTVEALTHLLESGLRVCISTTETPANADHIGELHSFRRSLGIADEEHFVRPLAKRGFSAEGVEIRRENLEPELTVTSEGVYWHPLTFPGDEEFLVQQDLFPLAGAVERIERELACGEARAGRAAFT